MIKQRFSTWLLVLSLGAASLQAATLEHRYAFASDVSDSVGGADGSLSRRGASVSGGALVLDGSRGYATLPQGIVSGYADCTIETWVTDYGSGQWARIFDFGNDTTTYMFLSPSSGAGTLRESITLASSAGEQMTEWTGTRLPAGSEVHVVWTYDAATTTSRLYVDGVMVAENTAVTLAPSDMGYTSNNLLGRSQWSDPYFWGTINEFRIYDGALTAAEVQYNHTAGADTPPIGPVSIIADPESQSVVEGDTVTFEVAYVGSPPFAVQWYKNSVAVSGATNATYTVHASLSDNGAVFYAVVSNTDGGSGYNVASAAATLTVNADTAAP
ncbi:MAG: hypothetical protein JW713_05035, partial [Pontiellaceae bacterium]|nr:hypothetical protein [Pontiellaceae bacterium]